MRLERAYYDCPNCKTGFCPRDRGLGLEGRSLSPAVTRMVGTVGALVSFQEGSELLSELSGIEVGAKQVERTAEALGREIAQHERQVVESANSSEIPETLLPGSGRHRGADAPLRARRPRRQAARRIGQDPRGETVYAVECPGARRGGSAGARSRLGELLRRHRDGGHTRRGPRSSSPSGGGSSAKPSGEASIAWRTRSF